MQMTDGDGGIEETDGGGVEETDGGESIIFYHYNKYMFNGNFALDGRGTSSSSPYFSSTQSSTLKAAAARPSVVARAKGGGGSTVHNGGDGVTGNGGEGAMGNRGEGFEESGVYKRQIITSTTTTVGLMNDCVNCQLSLSLSVVMYSVIKLLTFLRKYILLLHDVLSIYYRVHLSLLLSYHCCHRLEVYHRQCLQSVQFIESKPV